MKKLLSVLLAIAIIFSSASVGLSELDFSGLFAVRAEAANEEYLTFVKSSNGAYYSLTSCNKVAEGEVTIPSQYNGLPVKVISDQAFKGCSMITSVIIPDSVYQIGYEAFCDCTSLESVDISDNVTSLGSAAFKNCKSLKSFVIPDSVTQTNYYLFYGCTSLTSVTIGKGLKRIDSWFFQSCPSLKSIVIPDNITIIEEWAFSSCTGLTSVEIGKNVKTIEGYAFAWCKNIEYVYIPANTSLIEVCAFFYCDGLISFSVDENNENYTSYDGVLFNKNKTILKQYPSEKPGASYTIPSSVASVEELAFRDCDNLISVEIPDNVKIIDQRAFEECDNLVSVELSNSLSMVSYDMFTGCVSLESIVIPDSVKEIDSDAFENCTSLTSCTIGSSVATIDTEAFSGCTSLESIILPISLTSIGDNCFLNCSGFKYVFYQGSEDEWNQIQIGNYNTDLENAFIHYNSTDHTYEWIVISAETCSKEGVESYKCIYCDLEKDSAVIPAHEYDVCEWVVTTEPTCKTEGVKTGYCGECGEACASEVIPTIDHNYDYDNYEYVTNPENKNEFLKQYKCTYCGATKFDEVAYVPKALIIDSLPDKTSYIEGQEIDTTGLVVKAEFEDGTIDYITNYEMEYDNTVVGEQEVIVRCGDVTASFTVTFTAKTLLSITVTKMPDKTTYFVGDSFDKTGMVVTATYDSGLSEEVTDFTVSTLPKTAGTKNLIVSYSGKKVIIQVTVIEKKAVSMTVVEPENMDQIIGCGFDTTGMVVTVTYNDGTSAEVTDYTIEGFGDFVGVGCVYVTYDDISYELIIIAHSPEDAWVIETQGDCTTDGLKHLYCTECGEIIKTETIAATGHAYSTEWTIDVQATCTENGSKSRHCLHCDDKIDVTEIIATGHNFSEWTVSEEATCVEEGSESRCCSICGETEYAVIEKTDHSYGDYEYDYDANIQFRECTVCGYVSEEKMTSDGLLTFVLSEDGTYYTVDACNVEATGEIVIPATYNGLPVTSIGTSAFSGCTNITSIKIPDSVSNIWNPIFNDCISLVSIDVDENNAHYVSIDGVVFSKDKTKLVCYPAGKADAEYVIPDGVTTISAYAFRDAVNITSVTVPDSVTYIGISAFLSCENLLFVFYPGTQEQWDSIEIIGYSSSSLSNNRWLYNAIKHYEATDHIMGEWTITKEPTCTHDGEKTAYCVVCKNSELDSLGLVPETTVTLSAIGHNYSTEWTIDVVPTCTENGSKSHHCLNCADKTDVTEIVATGHSYNATITKEVTCETNGVRTWSCENGCGDTFSEVIPATGHKYDKGTVTVEATCETDGVKTYSCMNNGCGSTYTAPIPATGHTTSDWIVDKEANCTTVGSKHKECTVCGEILETVEIPVTGHNYSSEWTIDVEPTCIEKGSKSHHCLNCDDKTDVTEIVMTGHSASDWIIDFNANCMITGSKHIECTVCGETLETEVIPAGHEYSEDFIIDSEPTCSKSGWKSRHCIRCGSKIELTSIPLLPHEYSEEFTVDALPTCTKAGSKSRHCLNCTAKTEVITIAATGHTYGEWKYDENYETNIRECTVCGDVVTDVDYLTFTLSDDGTYYTVTGCDTSASGVIKIPSKYNGLPVSKIGYMAFWKCKSITSVEIPDSVIDIGGYAFGGCSSLSEITIPDCVTHIGGDGFAGCTSLTYIELPDGITSLSYNIFRECTSLTDVTIPDSVTTICGSAFKGCTSLTEITIPNSVTTIEDSAFLGCSKLATVVIPESVTTIGESVFGGCVSFAEIELPNSITRIGDGAFYNTGYYKEASNWTDDVLYIGKYLVEAKETIAGDYTVKDGTRLVADCTFERCENLISIIFPDGVKFIGQEAFDGCVALTSVVFEGNVESIDEQAFLDCDSLESFEIPYGIVNIEREILANCDNLKSVSIPDTVITIGEGAFCDNPSLESIEIPESVETIDEGAFVGCTALESIKLPDGLKHLGSGAFAYCSLLKSIEIPEGITALGEYTFGGCSNLETIVIKGKLTNIDDSCFYECVDLKYIFYAHSEDDWNEIVIADENSSLNKAVIHFNSTDHTYEWNITQEATCTDFGTKVQDCIYCDFQKATEIIPATGHTYGSWIVDAEATCETDGSRHRECGICQATETDTISATGHKYLTEWIIEKEATCEEAGAKYRQCYSCDSKVTESILALGHDYSKDFTVDIEATCEQEGLASRHCSRCDSKTDETVIEKTTHDYSDWVVTSAATCEKDGERAQICVYCDDKITETIDALGHVYSSRWTTDKTPTCTVAGSKSHHCNRPSCNSKKDVTEIPATGHSFGEWEILEIPTCTINGERLRMCNSCYVEEVEVIKALGHSYGEWTVESTADCTTDGKRHATCDTCGFVNNETVKAYDHDYESVFTVDKEATCTESGLKSRHCSRCEEKVDITTVVALGHHVSTMWTIDTEPTCETQGSKSHHCLRCDAISDITPIPVASHIYGKWEVVTPATMDTDGVRAHKCYNCDVTEEGIIPKLLKYTATFVADGEIVATVDFPEDATEIAVPEVPHKDKYNGEWENFDVRNKNFTVNAIYTPVPVDEIDGITASNSADYFSSTGEVEINLNVSAPGKTIVATTTKAVPLDIIFVLDQSGSMADGGKKTSLKNAVTTFSNAILEDAKTNSVDHRIAVVGFASGSNNNLNYQNTELLTSDIVKYNKITNADYKNALVSVNADGELNKVITDAVKAIDAEGATRADLGFEMASNIFANNPVTDNRQRVVVFLTDGEPTSYSGFDYGVANVAIKNAYQLKNTYDATVYSVGVFDATTSADNAVNNFMNYVSSNYNEEAEIMRNSKDATENTNGYYFGVSDVDNLSEVFTSIVEETTTHTGSFTNATLKYTLTKYFTLTSVQEEAIRKSAIENLGVANEQITITRNSDGTTTILISGVEPWAEGSEFVIDFTFRATANGNTLKSGTYQVGTFESGVILENGEGYEAVFAPNSVDIGGTSGIAVFNINNIPYAINRLSSTTKVVAPATSYGADYNFIGWNIPENLTLNNEVRVFDAELLKNEYKIFWNIDGEIIEEIYAVGDFIAVPEVSNNSIGGAFIGWDKTIPATMPSENLTITALYDAHYHKHNVTKDFELCTEGGILTYTCECGDTYTEEIESGEHSWEVITASNNKNAIENAGSRCSVCGIKDSKALRLEGKDTHQSPDASYNTSTVELDYIDENGDKHQPEGNIEISVQLDEVFENDIPENATASVYRVNDDGSRTLLESEQNGMNMTFTTDHFSTYEFEFTTMEQKYLFAQNGTEIDYANKLIFSNTYMAKEFKSIVTYLLPAKLTTKLNSYGYLTTGATLDLTKDGATDSYKVIVNGDLNGDGVCDILDAAYAEKSASGHEIPTEEEIWAANGCVSDELDVASYQNVVNMALAS